MSQLAGSAGPHVFVDSLDELVVGAEDLHHLTKSLRLRPGAELTASDGAGSWIGCLLGEGNLLVASGEPQSVPKRAQPVTVAFSLVKGSKPELAIQKLTELGVDEIVVLDAERSVVRWDDAKVESNMARWERIVREAAMQSHRVRLPALEALVPAVDWLSRPEVYTAHFGGSPMTEQVRSAAIGPEGGWSEREVKASEGRTVTLGSTVLRAETAAIAVGTLLCAAAD